MMSGEATRILVIDQDKALLDSCVETLIARNHVVATVMDSAFGLEMIKEFQPDIVLVDLNTYGIPGIEALERILEFDPTIVVIATAWTTTVSSTVEAMRRGAFEYLPKPFSNEELCATVEHGIEHGNLIKETAFLRREREMLREQFAAIVSHELKAPLGSILQNLYVLEHELADQLSPKQAERLGRMKVSIDDLLSLIKSWLNVISDNGDISKIRDNFEPVFIPDVITKSIENVEGHAVRKDIELIPAIEGGVGSVLGDRVHLCEAMVNLIGNAVKYSRMGSRIHITAEKQGASILIAVMDRGVGISKEDLPYIFGDFYVGKSAPAEARGNGIGLAITRRIVEAHDGTITVESSLGKGSTFIIRLPAMEAEPEEVQQAERVEVNP
jgi:two-component system sensor histidine kinase/response regulator